MEQLQRELDQVQSKPDVQAIQEELDKVNKEMNAIIQKHKDVIRKKFHESLKAIFTRYPEVTMIVWGQGTPGFCDGDPCYFTVEEPVVVINGKPYGDYDYGISIDGEEIEYEDLIDTYCPSDERIADSSHLTKEDKCDEEKKRAVEIWEGINKIIQLCNSILEDMFDGDALVIVTPDNITNDYYDMGY